MGRVVGGDALTAVCALAAAIADREVRASARLLEDLGLDSIQFAELVFATEELAGRDAPEDLIETWATVADLAAFVTVAREQAAGQVGEAAVVRQPGDRGGPPLPLVSGRHVALVSLTDPLLTALHAAMTGPGDGFRYRFHGGVPNPQEFVSVLLNGSLVSFALTTLDGSLVGFVGCSNADLGSGFAHIEAFILPEFRACGWWVEGLVLFVEHVFMHFDLRKLYLESSVLSVPQFESALDRLVRVEGSLREHQYFAGRFVDVLICALYRDDFFASEIRRTVIASLQSSPRR